jgi:hypothetical protein
MEEHNLATAADFRKRIKDEDCYEPPEEVTLPKCGLKVLLRRPKPLAYTLIGVPLPGIPKAEAQDGRAEGDKPTHTQEDILRLARWTAGLWSKVFVHPKLSLRPGDDEIHPDWIPEEDLVFIWKWIRAEVETSGESLSTFPHNA